jgi:hypothetical protein
MDLPSREDTEFLIDIDAGTSLPRATRGRGLKSVFEIPILELVKGILALYPQAQIIPHVVPLEDEEISMEVRLPVPEDELSHARDRIHGLVIQLQEEYDVLILVYTVPLHD